MSLIQIVYIPVSLKALINLVAFHLISPARRIWQAVLLKYCFP